MSVKRLESMVTLSSGVKMPRLGLGVFKAGPGASTRQAVRRALEVGYRQIDTASIYGNEAEVGQAVRAWCEETGRSRAEVFVTTKLWRDHHGYEAATAAIARSQEALGLGAIDQYLIHWPVPEQRAQTWRALEDALAQGLCRTIGVSNFTIGHLESLLKGARVIPAVNQIELHPFLPQRELVAWGEARGIQAVAYSPLTKGRCLDDPALVAVAQRLGKSVAQVLIRWGLERGHVVLPKSSHPQRIAQNAQVFDFELDEQAHRSLDALAQRPQRLAWDPTLVP